MFSTSIFPEETDASLVIYANAVLTGAVAPEQFETVAGWRAEIFDKTALIDHAKFSQRDILYIGGQLSAAPAGSYQLGFPIREALEHKRS